MAANYSTNPTNPMNQSGGQMPSQQQPQGPVAQPLPGRDYNPKSIRDYVAAARSAGATPTFSNSPTSPGFQMDVPQQQQAMPEGPQSEYEKTPFMDRIKRDPYQRAQERVSDFLPELWQSTFPGLEQGAALDQNQMKHWEKAVGSLTSNLLKRFDKQYEWGWKQEAKNKDQRRKDEMAWRSKYVDATLRGTPVLNADGTPMAENDFVKERLDNADEMRFKEDENRSMLQQRPITEELDFDKIQAAMTNNPALGKAIMDARRAMVEEMTGRQLSDDEYRDLHGNPEAFEMLESASLEAINAHGDQLRELTGNKVAINVPK